MVRALEFLADGQSPEQQRLGVVVAGFPAIDHRQPDETLGHVEVIFAEDLLANRQGALQERHRLVVMTEMGRGRCRSRLAGLARISG